MIFDIDTFDLSKWLLAYETQEQNDYMQYSTYFNPEWNRDD